MKDKPLVVLRGAIEDNLGDVFFTHNSENPELSEEGEKWYDVVGYADTTEEAQSMIAAEQDSMIEAANKLEVLLVSE